MDKETRSLDLTTDSGTRTGTMVFNICGGSTTHVNAHIIPWLLLLRLCAHLSDPSFQQEMLQALQKGGLAALNLVGFGLHLTGLGVYR